jgi:glycosyltransferase involved in cell wall biosynthesis
MLRWSLCVATYNRAAALRNCVVCALAQTRPPCEIVVVDSSDDWSATRDMIAALCADRPEIALRYEQGRARSSAAQRNQAIEAADGDVLFLIDDDSFLHPDCAERIMAVYEADADGAIAGVCANNTPEPPAVLAAGGGDLERKASGVRAAGGLRKAVLGSRAGRWINAKLFMQDRDELFLEYEPGRAEAEAPAWAASMNARRIRFSPGFASTVRRAVALREPFETSLRFYTAFEDLDASYRYRRHGVLLEVADARVHHFEAASGRVSRTAVTALQLLNTLVFIKRRAAAPEALLGRYRTMLARRLLSETLKDLLARRWGLPQVAGVMIAIRSWREVFATPAERLDDWYPAFQKRLIERTG